MNYHDAIEYRDSCREKIPPAIYNAQRMHELPIPKMLADDADVPNLEFDVGADQPMDDLPIQNIELDAGDEQRTVELPLENTELDVILNAVPRIPEIAIDQTQDTLARNELEVSVDDIKQEFELDDDDNQIFEHYLVEDDEAMIDQEIPVPKTNDPPMSTEDDEVVIGIPINGLFPTPIQCTSDGLVKHENDALSGKMAYLTLVSMNEISTR